MQNDESKNAWEIIKKCAEKNKKAWKEIKLQPGGYSQ